MKLFKKLILRVFIALIALGLLAIPALYLIALNSPTVSAAWFNDNWGYRQRIPINTHTASETNVYNEITVDTASLTTDKLQADCDDLRFSKQNGQILPYQIVSGCDTATTTIRVGFDTMPVAPFDIYMYYGNPSVSAGSQTLTHSACGNGCAEGSFASEEKAPSPAAYWKFDDSQGQTAQDSTTNNNDGTLGATSGVEASDPTWQTEDMCVAGKCLKFDGGDYVNASNGSSLNLTGTTVTVNGWFKVNNGFSGLPHLVSKWDSSNTGYVLWVNSDGTPRFTINGGYHAIGSTLSANTWYFLTGVYDGTSIKIYVNGALSGSQAYTSSILTTTANLTIGIRSDTSYGLNGFADDVKIYPYARSAAQILADYNSRGNNEGTSAVFGQVPSSKFQVLSDGLVGYWKMDESSWNGTANEVVDSSGNGNHGTSAGSASTTTGKFGNGGSFDGTDDYISDGTVASMSSYTMSAWFKTTATSGWGYIMGRHPSSSGTFISLNGNNNTGLRFSANLTGGEKTVDSTGNVRDNAWHFVAGTHDGSAMRIYVDGVLQNTTTGASGTQTSFTFKMGNDGANWFSGQIDEARIYNRALSPAEVSALYNFAPGPRLLLKMDEKSGTSAFDSSGNGRTGTINGNPLWSTGKYGSGVKMDGTGDNITISDF